MKPFTGLAGMTRSRGGNSVDTPAPIAQAPLHALSISMIAEAVEPRSGIYLNVLRALKHIKTRVIGRLILSWVKALWTAS